MSTVLALDGDEIAMLTLRDILETFGHTLVPVGDPQTVLRLLTDHPFDLMLVDIGLPGLAATDLIAQWARLRPNVRIIAMTSSPKGNLATGAMAAGAHSLMKKPYEVGRLLHLLEGPRS